MKFLTFDTSLDKTYITLFEDSNMLSERIIDSTDERYHSAYLMPAIVEILKENNILMQHISAIGTNIGPGSFTGIRVCNTISRVFAQQLNAKLVGISSLQILSRINTSCKNSLILMDARKNKVYFGMYSPIGEEIEAPKMIEKEEALSLAKLDFAIIADNSIHNFLQENGISSLDFQSGEYDLGKNLAYFTRQKLQNTDDDFHWAKVKPLYIQPPSITKPKAK
ncbi:MAG: tRNA (adenosine(37)-N6)-threonylcarbamoyltransferase complex dimerization subunit type 1 TsaB [Candidatus Gastranaerophilales bacterium]|nr:tRNA (adenosine(37)-N6)-threonylcarbamoyltransferase complex dimerization subunit type 1 TsaB [Candidatus Gastranaerophilales bacterium]